MRIGRTSAVAHCSVCDAEWGGIDNALREAAEHTRRTGHRTTGEEVIAYEWTRTTKTPEKRT
jgi:hypothetical protein